MKPGNTILLLKKMWGKIIMGIVIAVLYFTKAKLSIMPIRLKG